MQTILQDMQKEGKILVIPEGNCMHITPVDSSCDSPGSVSSAG